MDEWKDALERALLAAPNASTLSNSPSFQTEALESLDGSSEQGGSWPFKSHFRTVGKLIFMFTI